MTILDAIHLIDNPWLHTLTKPTRWADLGCGEGTFTLALAELLPPGSTIEAIDLDPKIEARTTSRGVTITPRKADFIRLNRDLTALDGVLMANSLHYVRDQHAFLTRVSAPILLVEYDTDRLIPQWVPYPVSFDSAARLFKASGWASFEKLATRPSSFGNADLYSALALPAASAETSPAEASAENRDPSTISPSAYALLHLKGETNIPFAHAAATLLQGWAPPNVPKFGTTPAEYWARVMHFESRYRSIDQLLSDLTATNIMEISSGFSFRGLDLTSRHPVHYLDTDLPNIVSMKQKFIDALTPNAAALRAAAAPGHYDLVSLDALDPTAFEAAIARLPPGPLTIVNEGLLVYLSPTEKEQLCHNILNALRTRGGHWITADIYIRHKTDEKEKDTSWRRWAREHQIDEKKFAGFEEAENFFHRMGFKKEKEATPDYSSLTSLKKFIDVADPQALEDLRRRGRTRVHATWRLTPR